MNHPTGAATSVRSLCTAEAASQRCVLWMNLLALSLVLCPGLSGNLIAQPFVRINASLPSTFPDRASWADYDADGDMDLLAFDLVDVNTWEPRRNELRANHAAQPVPAEFQWVIHPVGSRCGRGW